MDYRLGQIQHKDTALGIASIQDNNATDYYRTANMSDIVDIKTLEQLLSTGYCKVVVVEGKKAERYSEGWIRSIG